MVQQIKTSQPVLYHVPIGDEPRVMIPWCISPYYLLPSIGLHAAGISHFHVPPILMLRKVAITTSGNIKKKRWGMVWTPRLTRYMYTTKTHQQCLDHYLTYRLCNERDGEQKNRQKVAGQKCTCQKDIWDCAAPLAGIMIPNLIAGHHAPYSWWDRILSMF